MAKAQDFTVVVNDALAALPFDVKAMEKNFRATAVVNEKLSNVALSVAGQWNDIVSHSTKDAISALATVGKAKADPADYAKALTEFANFATNQAVKNFSNYAEITLKAQSEAVELLVSAGKEASNEAAAAVHNAAAEATKVAKKAVAAK
ncbi:phasin family protein [Ruegeria hyattellae]|uniref:phasin family protein n=1 Tax=Ruegeria hyattellae TaxID=3233337 RepID=UPI00355BFC97